MSDESSTKTKSYTVVARRYRPRTFTELIGQEHIAQALSKAIASGRVGHAYLFAGARGVGKTSTARIFAKALNAPDEKQSSNTLDIAAAIESGEDMDMIEIDGASNRGIEEIRQLRANVAVRPSRARFKIYIIDEVHMLTSQAFNALLKTLEEPPEHVKFIFCTTDPDKLPITVLSRCQRFDFVPVKFEAIQQRLKEISRAEGFDAEDEALALLARKAAGSMRDSQSLLEQVMSFSTERITADQVHALLGTADEGRLLDMVEALRNRSPLDALSIVDEATRGGADPGQLAEQLLNYLRDVMTAGVGGGPDLLKLANPAGHQRLTELAQNWGIQTILSAIQILDESLVRMRSSVSASTLLEVALVQVCQLQDLALIPAMIEALARGGPLPTTGPPRPATPASTVMPKPYATEAEKKKVRPEAEAVTAGAAAAELISSACSVVAESSANAPYAKPVEAASTRPTMANLPNGEASGRDATTRSPGNASALADWLRSIASIDGMLADFAGLAQSVEPLGSDQWTIYFPPGSNKPKEYCEVSDRKNILLRAVERTMGRSIRLNFVILPGSPPHAAEPVPPANLRAQKMREVAEHPLVKRICELLGGEIVRVDGPAAPPAISPTATRVPQPVNHAS